MSHGVPETAKAAPQPIPCFPPRNMLQPDQGPCRRQSPVAVLLLCTAAAICLLHPLRHATLLTSLWAPSAAMPPTPSIVSAAAPPARSPAAPSAGRPGLRALTRVAMIATDFNSAPGAPEAVAAQVEIGIEPHPQFEAQLDPSAAVVSVVFLAGTAWLVLKQRMAQSAGERRQAAAQQLQVLFLNRPGRECCQCYQQQQK